MAELSSTLAATTQPLATDARSLEALRSRSAINPKSAVRETARQFEALFMNELVKSMRATTLQSSESSGMSLGTDMLDSQLALQMSGQKGGLSDAISRYLERQMGLTPGPIPSAASANPTPAPLDGRATRMPQTAAASFVEQHTGAAQKAEASSGIPATFMVAQAAHETGWGRKEIRHADGSPSYNLFGIKAGGSWTGPVAEVPTTEYVNGVAKRVTARFRAYSSYAESFADYARLMKDSPRYQQALAAATRPVAAVAGRVGEAVRSAGMAAGVAAGVAGGAPRATSAALTVAQSTAKAAANAAGFAQGLQKAGYATDPAYAEKLTRVINTTLRLQRSLTA